MSPSPTAPSKAPVKLPLLSPGSSPEAYALDLGADDYMARLVVSSYNGLLRGLETFSQLVATARNDVGAELLRVPAFIHVQ